MPVPPQNADTLPPKDADLVPFAQNFANVWVPADFGVAAPLAADIQALLDTYIVFLDLSTDPATRTPITIVQKNETRAALSVPLRRAIRFAVSAFRAGIVGPATLTALNIRPPDLTKTSIPAPADAPVLAFVNSTPGVINYRLTQVYSGVPVSTIAFQYGIVGIRLVETWTGGSKTSTIKRVNIASLTGGLPQGTIVTATACYFNARGDVGPVCPDVTAVVG